MTDSEPNAENPTTPTTVVTTPPPPPPPPPPAERVERDRGSRVSQIAAWVGIVAGTVFVVAVIFFSGFVLGKSAGGGGDRQHGGPRHEIEMLQRGGPPMGPPHIFFPGGPGGGPGGPAGPGGPGLERGPAAGQGEGPAPGPTTIPR